MPGFGKTSTVRAEAGSDRSQDADIYDRFGVGLYRQALLTLRDPALAGHVVCDVIVDECRALAAAGARRGRARHRLAESASGAVSGWPPDTTAAQGGHLARALPTA
jgi:hypothetical protein